MANKIIPKKSSVASKVPLATDLEVGEIAFNLADKKIYSKDAGGTVIEMGGGTGGTGDVVGPASATDNALVRFDGTTGKLVQDSAVVVADSGITTITGTSDNTNSVLDVLRINHQTILTPAVGIGTGMEFAVETAAGNTEVGATIEAITTDVTAGSEDFDLVFRTMAAGAAAAERVRITSTGALSVGDAATTRTNLGLAIGTNVQAYDADLAAVAALSTNGMIARTGAGTAAVRTITGTANQITVTNGNGVSGNPTLSIPSGPQFSGAVLNDGYTEEVFAVTGTTPALSPTNGSIQTWTLTANSTPTAGTWAAGQSITLMVDDGTAYTITWTSLAVTWKTDGGTAPTLNTTGLTAIALWKVGTTIYGARVGDA